MRDIKFRGKRINPVGVHIWAYGYYSKNRDGSVIWLEDEWGGWVDIPVIPETVGQFTGRKDEKDRELYEGDIVEETIDYSDFIKKYRGYVEWNTDVGICVRKYDGKDKRPSTNLFYEMGPIEIIGNIHDNPELMEAK